MNATPAGSAFGRWTGACSGSQLSCALTVNGQMTAAAAFLSQYALSVGRSNSGTVNRAGGCSGTSPGCDLTIAKDTSVQAVFGK